MNDTTKAGKRGLPQQLTVTSSGQVVVDIDKLIGSEAIQRQVRTLEQLIGTSQPPKKIQAR